jgi:hypothetical protein
MTGPFRTSTIPNSTLLSINQGEAEDLAELSAKDGIGYCMASVHRRGSADAIDATLQSIKTMQLPPRPQAISALDTTSLATIHHHIDLAELSAKDGIGYCMASVHRRGSADAIDGSASIGLVLLL